VELLSVKHETEMNSNEVSVGSYVNHIQRVHYEFIVVACRLILRNVCLRGMLCVCVCVCDVNDSLWETTFTFNNWSFGKCCCCWAGTSITHDIRNETEM